MYGIYSQVHSIVVNGPFDTIEEATDVMEDMVERAWEGEYGDDDPLAYSEDDLSVIEI